MEKKQVILFCVNNLGAGGAERLVIDDINEMLKRGLNVRLVTLTPEPKSSISTQCNIKKENWTQIKMNSIWDIAGWIRSYKFLKETKPDLIFTHLWFSNTVLRPLSRILKHKVISFEHNVYEKVKTKKMYFTDRLFQNFSHKIVAVSSAVKESLIKHGIKEKNIVVVNNGIELSKYKTERNISYRKNLNIPEDLFVFTTIGRLIEQKGIDILIEAFSKLDNSSHLVIVGAGKEEGNLKNLANDLSLGGRIHFLGIRQDVPEILAMSDCFVLASRYEGLGIVVLEAMASKLPIIISDFPAGKDMIKNGENGLVVEKENAEDLAKAMNKIFSNAELRENLAKNALKRVTDFSIQNHVNKILSL